MTIASTLEPLHMTRARSSFSGAVQGTPSILLRFEGGAACIAAVLAYHELRAGWILFALLILAPDISMLGYLAGRRVGAAVYNAGHSYLASCLLAMMGWPLGMPALYSLALIWVAHIGFDRLLGYGLKYPDGFWATHLGIKHRGKRS